MDYFQRFDIALAVVIGQIILIFIIWKIFKHINNKLDHASGKDKIKPLKIKHIRILTAKQFINLIHVFLRIIKYFITFVLLFITIPIVFSLFPSTRDFASMLFGHILTPLKNIADNIVEFIPNLITIIIIVTITRYVLKMLKFFADRIAKGKLVIPGFYSDWAAPTLKIIQVFLWAFTLAVVYPYLPGSDSRAFQGVSVFLGVVFSIGSTSVIGNLIAGFVITYMRPFKIGDRIKINEVTGFVVEKNLVVVRLKTDKNEYVTFPNIMIMGSNTINYNTSSDEDEDGLIIYAEITFGYETPWQTVHDILINAAFSTHHVQKTPKPFVLQTKLDDFYAGYQINCYIKEISKIPDIYTMLNKNIQDGFREAGLDMTSSHFRVITSK
jgi:small-conductance mechanosensitive channel